MSEQKLTEWVKQDGTIILLNSFSSTESFAKRKGWKKKRNPKQTAPYTK